MAQHASPGPQHPDAFIAAFEAIGR